jgi:uncharacterized protein
MELEYDDDKDVHNLAKHGVSLAAASRLRWDTLLAWEDRRRQYGEPRMAGLALMNDRLYAVVYVDRGAKRRIISLRRANRREVRRYASED